MQQCHDSVPEEQEENDALALMLSHAIGGGVEEAVTLQASVSDLG